MPLKLGELEVLSKKLFFKVFDKSKSRPIEKMRMQDLLVFGSRQLHFNRPVSITTEKFQFCENKGTRMKQKLSC